MLLLLLLLLLLKIPTCYIGGGWVRFTEDRNAMPMSTLKNQHREIPLSSQYSHRDADNKMREFEQQRLDRLAIDLYSPHIHAMIA